MVSAKIAILALLILGFLYIVYRASDWYFTKKEAESKLELKERARKLARDEAIWVDDDPDSLDQDEFERALEELEDP